MKMFVLRVSSLCMMRAIYLRFVIESDSRCDKKQRVVFFHFLVTTTVAAVFFFSHHVGESIVRPRLQAATLLWDQ